MHTMFLDTNIWIQLTRDRGAEGDLWKSVSRAADGGRAQFPLIATHYLELWNRFDERSRRLVAETMRDISGYRTISPFQRVHALEIEALVASPGRPEPVPAPLVLGHGVDHAFDSPYGRFRFVARRATGEDPEEGTAPPPPGWDWYHAAEGYEWTQLWGPQNVIELGAGFDRTPTHRQGALYLDDELAIRAQLQADPSKRARLADLIVAEETTLISPELLACIERHGSTLGGFLSAVAASSPPETFRRVIDRIPTSRVKCALRTRKHSDLVLPWEQHDLHDLMTLSVAVPFCDSVVTERRWAHMLKASGTARAFGTQVYGGAVELRAALDALATATE